MSNILLNYAFLLFWSIFGEIHREIFFLVTKVTLSEMSTEILRKFVFLTMFEKGKILWKIWICLNNFFDQSSKMGQTLSKTLFLHKVSHILLFCCFEVFSGRFIENFSFKSKKWPSQKRALKYTEICFSNHVWKVANPEENLDLFKQLFLIKPVKGDNINKNCFSHQSEPHTAKLCLPVVLKDFWLNL